MKYYVTTPIYYVNDRPHIGHVYTTIAADVLARWHRQKGDEVLFSTGVDENSQKNVEAAEKAGKPVQEYVDGMATVWEETFKQLGFTNDSFIRTTSPEHGEAVKQMLKTIEQQGDIYLGEYEGLYCTGCEAFLKEDDLLDGSCPVHKTPPKKIKEKNYFFRLSKYRDALLDHYRSHPDFVRPDSARNEVLNYIENHLEDISISRQSQAWGIRLPQDESHAIYVWFDALINYLTVAGYPASDKWWPADMHIVGRDIVKFHCAIWPAMLLSAGLSIPERVFANGFFTINGQKISKSLGNTINPLDLIKEYPFDAVRYFVLREIPFGQDGDFSLDRLKERYNSDLANGLGNLVSRTLNMIEKFGRDRDLNSDYSKINDVSGAQMIVEKSLKNLSFDRGLTAITNLAAKTDAIIEKEKPWELAKNGEEEKLEVVLDELFRRLNGINDLIAPFMPETHEKLTQLLSARPVKKPSEPLFARK